MKIKRIASVALAATMMVGTAAIAVSADTDSAAFYVNGSWGKTYTNENTITQYGIKASATNKSITCGIYGIAAWSPSFNDVKIEMRTTNVDGKDKTKSAQNGLSKNFTESKPFSRTLDTKKNKDLDSGYFCITSTDYNIDFKGYVWKKPATTTTTTTTRAC